MVYPGPSFLVIMKRRKLELRVVLQIEYQVDLYTTWFQVSVKDCYEAFLRLKTSGRLEVRTKEANLEYHLKLLVWASAPIFT